MITYLIKLIISAATIVFVSELGKRISWLAALVASLPLTSILALTWLYFETKSPERVMALSTNILWAVIPSLTFFIVLPLFLKWNLPFSLSMGLSILIMFIGYLLYAGVLKRFGVLIQTVFSNSYCFKVERVICTFDGGDLEDQRFKKRGGNLRKFWQPYGESNPGCRNENPES